MVSPEAEGALQENAWRRETQGARQNGRARDGRPPPAEMGRYFLAAAPQPQPASQSGQPPQPQSDLAALRQQAFRESQQSAPAAQQSALAAGAVQQAGQHGQQLP